MDFSGYAKIESSSSGVDILCTDVNIIEWLLEELKKYIPSDQLLGARGRPLISGEIYEIGIRKLQGKDDIVAFWALKQFVLQGWEPFETRGDFPSRSIYEASIHLRFTGTRAKE